MELDYCTQSNILSLFSTDSYAPDSCAPDSCAQEPETEPPEEDKNKLVLGNLPPDIRKPQIDHLVKFMHEVISYRLRQHKDNRHDL